MKRAPLLTESGHCDAGGDNLLRCCPNAQRAYQHTRRSGRSRNVILRTPNGDILTKVVAQVKCDDWSLCFECIFLGSDDVLLLAVRSNGLRLSPDTDGQNKVPIPAPIPVPAPIQRRLHQGPFDDDRPIAAPVPLKPDGGVVQPSPTPDPTSDLCTDLAKAGANLPSYCK